MGGMTTLYVYVILFNTNVLDKKLKIKIVELLNF